MSEKCSECGSYGRHSPICNEQTLEEAKENTHHYYNAWLKQLDRDRTSSGKLRKQLIFMQGKYMMVKHENNKLRNKVYKRAKI